MLRSQIPGYFKARRDALLKAHPGSVFILPANPEFIRNPDVHYPYRQESCFYYLSGFDEPETFLVIAPSKGRPGGHRMALFVRKRDKEREIWEGERYGIDGARGVFGADEAYLNEEFERRLPELLQGAERVYYRLGLNEATDRVVLSALENYRRGLGRSGSSLPPIVDPAGPIGEMRLFKSPEEIELLRKACSISARAHKIAMIETRTGSNEYELEALVDYSFRRGGCERIGYGSIVAGGRNACCLHYRANNEPLRDGELLLIDAGGEYDYYTADITRTFPVGGRFTDPQARIYDVVLSAQKEAISMARPGATLPAIHRRATEVLVEGLLRLGLMKGKPEELIQKSEHRRFYPHGTSHWLGMDVHDVGAYVKEGEPRRLEPDMVFTIEPGLYIQPADEGVPSEFRGIGVRIEDDILITADGCEVLTREAPKERAEIEALRGA